MALKESLALLANASTIIAGIAAICAAVFVSLQVAHMKRSREVDTFLRVIEAGNTDALRGAGQWVKTRISPDTTYQQAGEADYRENMSLLINYFEMVGILVHRRYLSTDLVYDQMGSWIVGSWGKLRVLIAAHRTARRSPQYAENFELLALGYDAWAKRHPPKLETRERPSGLALEEFYSERDQGQTRNLPNKSAEPTSEPAAGSPRPNSDL
jgi:hypothetical protein